MFPFAIGFPRASRDVHGSAGAWRHAQPAHTRAANDGPAFDIVRKGEDAFAVVLAVPGYTAEELDVTAAEGVLTVKGQPVENDGPDALVAGIGKRPFTRRFKLARHVDVADVALADGLLRVDLERHVPEAQKPRSIAINAAKAA